MTRMRTIRLVFASIVLFLGPRTVAGAGASQLPPGLHVRTTTTGVDLDADGYRIQVWKHGWGWYMGVADLELPANGTAKVQALEYGEYVVGISGLAFNCDVTGPSGHVVTVGESWDVGVLVEFDVACVRGKTVAFSSTIDGNADIYVTDDIGTESVRLTVHPAADVEPAWSPDGSQIAFQTERDGNVEIYVMNADGSNPVRLTYDPGSDLRPAWSPDGGKIAFVSDRDGNREVYVMNADGTDVVNLSKHWADDADPAWSPDSTKIAFSSTRDSDPWYPAIYVMNADGSEVTRLTTEPWVSDVQPVWSPDGAALAFSRSACDPWFGCSRDIWTMNADGSNVGWHAGAGGYDDYYEPAWSRDGRRIAFGGYGSIQVTSTRPAYLGEILGILVSGANPDWRP